MTKGIFQWLVVGWAVLGLLGFASPAVAKTSTDSVSKYGVTFPISELGGCEDVASCRIYCDDPVNSAACIDYAKNKGFYKGAEQEVNKNKYIAKAKSELGCDSASACLSLCDQPSNFGRCSQFAQKYNLGGGTVESPARAEIITKAKEVLGCESESTCREYCQDDANRSKCSTFARQVGLRGGEIRMGPGGCTSEDTCRVFCSAPQNYQVCQGFAAANGGQFTGPGRCTSEETCRSYCEKNPSVCGSSQLGTSYNPAEMCNRTSGCYWTNNSCNCGSASTGPQDPAAQCVRYSGCTWTNNICSCATTGSTPYPTGAGSTLSRDQQEYYCQAGGGTCDWTTGICNCRGFRSGSYSGSGASPTPYSSGGSGGSQSTATAVPTTTMSREQQQAGCSSCGGTCNWSGDFCNCNCGSSGNTNTPAPSTPAPTTNDPYQACIDSGGRWAGAQCYYDPVRGVSVVKNIWRQLLDTLTSFLQKQ